MQLDAETLEFLQRRPDVFFEQILGITTLEGYQRRMLREIAANERTAIAACHDVGKSYTLARTVLWFMSTFPNSKVITTAPTYNQVKNILWAEIRAAHAKSKIPLGGVMNLTEWKLGDEWFAIGFTPKNEVSGEAGQGTQSSFQGFHAEGGLLVVFDEATGVPHPIWTMAEGLLTQAHVKFVAIANPTSKNSEFYKCFKSRDWAKVYLSCLDSPNFAANGINTLADLQAVVAHYKTLGDEDARRLLASFKAPRPYLLSVAWVVRNIAKWGWTHPLTLSKILGKFPETSDNTICNLQHVEDALARDIEPVESDRKILGVDVARFGTDASVITGMHGKRGLWKRDFNKLDAVFLTGEVIQAYRDLPGCNIIVIDETGIGGPILDSLRQAQREGIIAKTVELRGVNFGATKELCTKEKCLHKDCDKAKYFNMKAKIFGLLSDDLKSSDAISLPTGEEIYLEELPVIKYAYNDKGQLVIESKEDFKKRTGLGSPDHADSLALANYGRYGRLLSGSFSPDLNRHAPRSFSGSIGGRQSW